MWESAPTRYNKKSQLCSEAAEVLAELVGGWRVIDVTAPAGSDGVGILLFAFHRLAAAENCSTLATVCAPSTCMSIRRLSGSRHILM